MIKLFFSCSLLNLELRKAKKLRYLWFGMKRNGNNQVKNIVYNLPFYRKAINNFAKLKIKTLTSIYSFLLNLTHLIYITVRLFRFHCKSMNICFLAQTHCLETLSHLSLMNQLQNGWWSIPSAVFFLFLFSDPKKENNIVLSF